VVITLDTMRADRLPAYGFSSVATPALDRLAAEGVVFDRAFAAVPLTLPSHASLFTGLYPPRLGVRDNAGAPLAAEFTTLAEVMQAKGLTTAAFISSAVLMSGRGLDQGFTHYSGAASADCSGKARARRPADTVVDDALGWLERQDGKPFFAWIHLYDTHRPYRLPPAFEGLYGDPYLEAIAFEDSQIQRVIRYLEDRALLDDTLVVVAGDHGESLGDHGETSHGIFIYQEALHVPLILRGPGILPGRVHAITRLVDVTPTVLDLFGQALPNLDGVSLRGQLDSPYADPGLEVYAESLYPRRFGWASLRSLRADRYKVIEAPRPELYDLDTDPTEQRNIFDEKSGTARAMLSRLQAFERAGERRESAAVVDPAVAQRVSSLGYVGTGEVAAPAAGDEPDPKDLIDVFNRMTNQVQTAARLRAANPGCGPAGAGPAPSGTPLTEVSPSPHAR
jgi:arylsulfatase A-like enzyme